ncbi:MgtC/SapB family protein [Vibrio sp.]|nr:MgtC/SapB family protein [Vibrio sp.]
MSEALSVNIYPLEWVGLLFCLVNGCIIGIERQIKGKPVGLRTSTLVITGTYCFISLALSLSEDSLDHARVLGQIITGIGFLGAGVMMTQNGKIHGVTSAAVIWLQAGLGIMIGLGYNTPSLLLTLVVISTLAFIDLLESRFHKLKRGVHKNHTTPKKVLPNRSSENSDK